MKKQLLLLNLTMVLGLGSVFALPTAKAESISNNQSQEISSVRAELSRLNDQVERAEQAFIDNQNMIIKTEKDIAAINLEIQKTQKEITSLQDAIEKRNDVLKE